MRILIDDSNWGWLVAITLGIIWITFQIAQWMKSKETDSALASVKSQESRRSQEEIERMKQIFSENLKQQTKEIEKAVWADARAELRGWKAEYGAKVRQDAINRSKSVIAGKVAENIAPYMPMFPYNPKDARFLGSPIDFVVFDGLDEGELTEIVFLEIKSQGARLSEKQKQIKSVIEEGHVFFEELRIDGQHVELDVAALPLPEYQED